MAGIVGHFGRRDSKRGGVTRHDPTTGPQGTASCRPDNPPGGGSQPAGTVLSAPDLCSIEARAGVPDGR
jgi:hypothetical protein